MSVIGEKADIMWRGRFTSVICRHLGARFVPLTWRFALKGQSLTPAALDPIGCLTALLTKRLQLRRAAVHSADLKRMNGRRRSLSETPALYGTFLFRLLP